MAKKNQKIIKIVKKIAEDIDNIIEVSGLETLEYNQRWGIYRLPLRKNDIDEKDGVLKQLIGLAFQRRQS